MTRHNELLFIYVKCIVEKWYTCFDNLIANMDVHNQYPDEKYEGTEKLLEIWFFYEKDSFQSKTPNLMKMSR